ncbi:hypothetical protein RUM43_009481 [Polyplax serrata]|uniref:Uncharacterized protein n=1 Tax=Polyplax serrata TaxID=468196 RepID=A0AAN8RUG3_POLSC
MGQKLSELRGLLVAMDGEEEIETKETSKEETRPDDVGKNEKLRQISAGDESAVGSGNDGGNVKEHFENIYSNSSDSSLRMDEATGNLVPSPATSAAASGNASHCEGSHQTCACIIKSKNKLGKTRKSVDDHQHNGNLKRNGLRTMSFVTKRRGRGKTIRTKEGYGDSAKKRSTWVLKFNCAKLKTGFHGSSSSFVESDIPQPNIVCDSCVCTGYRRTEEHHLGAGVVFEANAPTEDIGSSAPRRKSCPAIAGTKTEEPPPRSNPIIDLSRFNPEDFPIEDCDERARLERAREIAEGVEPPPGFQPGKHIQLLCPPEFTLDNLTMLFQTHLGLHTAAALSALSQIDVNLPPAVQRIVHTQVDYIHCLVPDLLQITLSSFYWEGCVSCSFLVNEVMIDVLLKGIMGQASSVDNFWPTSETMLKCSLRQETGQEKERENIDLGCIIEFHYI